MSRISLCLALIALGFLSRSLPAAHLAMGLRVGEVTQDSAIVWTRITKNPTRNQDGYREPAKREPQVREYTPSPVAVDDREGAVPGAPGQVRVRYAPAGAQTEETSPWVAVREENDFVHQFRLTGLQPRTRYAVTVEARDGEGQPISATFSGAFATPAPADVWQDVRLGISTCQAYWDVDDPQGFHIYPAMGRLLLDFHVSAGDCVYLDSESPRARTVPLARYHWHRMYSWPRLVAFHSQTPAYWMKDDHDAWCNDCWPTMRALWMNPLTFEQGCAVFREQNPIGEKTYRTVRWGQGLQIWMVEGRDFRSPNNLPDGPEKTIWGREQKEWLKRTILESDAAFRVLISPTPIVGPDRENKADNFANATFAHEGNEFRQWTAENALKNFYVCCGDRHWQYLSIDPKTKLHEFSVGPASDVHAGGSPGRDPEMQPFHRVAGGFLTIEVARPHGTPTIVFRHRDVHGNVVHEFTARGE